MPKKRPLHLPDNPATGNGNGNGNGNKKKCNKSKQTTEYLTKTILYELRLPYHFLILTFMEPRPIKDRTAYLLTCRSSAILYRLTMKAIKGAKVNPDILGNHPAALVLMEGHADSCGRENAERKKAPGAPMRKGAPTRQNTAEETSNAFPRRLSMS